MAEGFKAGASGAALNYKVIGGTTEPGNPRKNTIWVNTDHKVTGHYFSATKPEEMAEGEVWIATGTSSTAPFNALKNNAVMVYPLRVKQKIQGALVDKTAKTYQNDKWVDWYTFLLKGGEDVTDITGGWQGYTASTSVYLLTPDVEFVNGCLRIYGTSNELSSGIGATKNMIYLSNANTLHIVVDSVTPDIKACVGLWSISGLRATFVAGNDVTAGGEVLVDVSGLSGSYYIGALIGEKTIEGLAEIFISDIYWE